MAEIGYTLSSEEQSPAALVANAARAEQAGFSFAGISDVYLHQAGPDQEGFFDFYERQILPELA